MKKEVRIGLVGLGFMGTTHLNVYKTVKGVRFAALADVDPAKRRGDVSKVAGNIGKKASNAVDLKGVTVYKSAFDLVKDPSIDIVDICVPTPDHTAIVLAALKAGKHVFCEKPLCRTPAEVRTLVAAVRKAKTFFNIDLCVRAIPEYRHAWEYYQSGKAGRMRQAFFHRMSPNVSGNAWENWYMDGKRSGGALLDLHVHDVDEVNYFFGRPKAVFAAGAADVVSKGGVDHVTATYDYGNGSLVVADGGWAAGRGMPFECSFTIICDKATMKLDASGYHVYPAKGGVITPKLPVDKYPTPWHAQIIYFLECVKKGVRPDRYQTIGSVADTMKIVFAEAKSAKTGRKVRI